MRLPLSSNSVKAVPVFSSGFQTWPGPNVLVYVPTPWSSSLRAPTSDWQHLSSLLDLSPEGGCHHPRFLNAQQKAWTSQWWLLSPSLWVSHSPLLLPPVCAKVLTPPSSPTALRVKAKLLSTGLEHPTRARPLQLLLLSLLLSAFHTWATKLADGTKWDREKGKAGDWEAQGATLTRSPRRPGLKRSR